jgi:hypothetical protein
MKRLKLKAIALALFVTAGFVSCNNDDDTPFFTTKKTLVSLVTGPTTGKVNQELTLNVTFAVDNNCGAFNKFIETTTDKTTVIEVEAKYEGSNCGATVVNKTTTYKFKATTVGTYILKFKKSATEFVTQTIVITTAP